MLTPVFRHFAREVACPSGLSLREYQLTGADVHSCEPGALNSAVKGHCSNLTGHTTGMVWNSGWQYRSHDHAHLVVRVWRRGGEAWNPMFYS